MWTITKTQDEDSWLDEYIARVIEHAPAPLPSHDTRIGKVEVHWHQVRAGIAYVAANPETGTVADRCFAESLVMAKLASRGFKQAVVHDPTPDLQKQSAWQDVQDKAKRLIQSGAVHLDLNTPQYTVATVQGDHGTYHVELHRNDPNNPQAVTSKFCSCDWGQFMNLPRTRQWKVFQNRSCAHCQAAIWLAQSVPMDESRAPGNQGEPGQMSLFDMSGGNAPGSMGLMRNAPMPNPNAWFMQPGAPPNAFNQQMPGNAPQGPQGPPNAPAQAPPPPEDVLPQFQGEPLQLPPVNPASTPGGRPGPTPTNPLQYPGGTFSSIQWRMAAQQFNNGDMVQVNEDDPINPGTLEGRQEGGPVGPTIIPKGAICEVLGTDPLGLVHVLWMGSGFDTNRAKQPFGVSQWFWPSQLTPRPDIQQPGPAIRRT